MECAGKMELLAASFSNCGSPLSVNELSAGVISTKMDGSTQTVDDHEQSNEIAPFATDDEVKLNLAFDKDHRVSQDSGLGSVVAPDYDESNREYQLVEVDLT